MRGLFVLVAALAVSSADFINTKVTSEAGAGPVYRVARERRRIWPFNSNPTEYSCQIAPYVSFYPADNTESMPAYLCSNGYIEILIATRSFHLGYNRYEYATYATLTIDPGILHIEYPGAFTETPPSLVYKHSNGVPQSQTVEITGLLFLTEGGIQRKTNFFQFFNPTLYNCHYLPSAIFHNADVKDVPVYRCIRGRTEILIASESFRDSYDPNRVSSKVELNIGDEILRLSYPGSFHQVGTTFFKGNPDMTHKGGEFLVRGMLRLAE